MTKSTFYISFLVLAIAGATLQTSVGQTFTMKAKKLEMSCAPGEYVDTDCEVKNLSGSDISVRVQRTRTALPAGWFVSFCLVNCYAPEAMDVTEIIPANSTFDFKLTWETPALAGEGEVEYVLTNLANTAEKYTFTFKVSTRKTSVDRTPAPKALTLAQNYPNPFSAGAFAVTTVGYTVPRQGEVSVKVFNLVGREVRTLVNEAHVAGSFSIAWDGRDAEGALVPPGIYIYKITTASSSLSRRMVVSR